MLVSPRLYLRTVRPLRNISMAKKKPKVIVFSGYGLNCEEETLYAFELAGAEGDIVHINDVIKKPKILDRYDILAMPGGFSYGDDTGSGRAYGNKLKNHLGDALKKFVERDTLTIGICNGFQILTRVGLLPGVILHNDKARYVDRWVDLKAKGDSPWLDGIGGVSMPIAHGEGKYYADKKTLTKLKKDGGISYTYTKGETAKHFDLPANPNGSVLDIASVTAYDGRVLGMMPHPERSIFFTQLPHWTYLKERNDREGEMDPEYGPGIQMFKNAVKYFHN